MWWLLATLLMLSGLTWLGRRYLGGARPTEERPLPESEPLLPDALPIGDELDLHGVPPRDVGELVDAFIEESLRQGRKSVRIIHGKGIGALRQTVRAHLKRNPAVLDYRDAPPPAGWGATVVELADPERDVAPGETSS